MSLLFRRVAACGIIARGTDGRQGKEKWRMNNDDIGKNMVKNLKLLNAML